MLTESQVSTDIIKVLLIEDNHADEILFRKTLAEVSPYCNFPEFHIGIVHTIHQAIDALKKHFFDLILLDLKLPDSDDIETLKTILSHSDDTPIVVYSGHYSSELARTAIALGVQDYIIKGSLNKVELARTLVHAKLRHDIIKKVRRIKNEVEDDE